MKLVLILVSLYLSTITSASVVTYRPSNKLPRELIYLTEAYAQIQLNDLERTKKINETFLRLNEKLNSFSKEEIFFISKSEIYKTCLAFRPNLSVKRKFYYKEIIQQTQEKINSSKLNSFSHWLLLSILKDAKILFKDKDYPTFLAEYSKGLVKSSSSKKIQKKLKFLLPWLQSFLMSEVKNFQITLLPLMEETLTKIEKKLDFMRSFNTRAIKEKSLFTSYFIKEKRELNKKGTTISVEDILAPLLNSSKNQNLPIPVDDWLEEDEFTKSSSPILPQEPTKNYIAPEKLPSPVDEW